MSIDRSLHSRSSLVRHRNVLTRAERVERLKTQERFAEDQPVLGLPKVANYKPRAGKKKAPPKGEGTEAAAATPAS
ncbi:MAG: small basic protein [Phycisphaerae bacterium]